MLRLCDRLYGWIFVLRCCKMISAFCHHRAADVVPVRCQFANPLEEPQKGSNEVRVLTTFAPRRMLTSRHQSIISYGEGVVVGF